MSVVQIFANNSMTRDEVGNRRYRRVYHTEDDSIDTAIDFIANNRELHGAYRFTPDEVDDQARLRGIIAERCAKKFLCFITGYYWRLQYIYSTTHYAGKWSLISPPRELPELLREIPHVIDVWDEDGNFSIGIMQN